MSLSSFQLNYFKASKGFIEILFIDLHMFQSGTKALLSIECIKMIVENISKIVIKQLLAMLIRALVSSIFLLLKINLQSSKEAFIIYTPIKSDKGGALFKDGIRLPGYSNMVVLVGNSILSTGYDPFYAVYIISLRKELAAESLRLLASSI